MLNSMSQSQGQFRRFSQSDKLPTNAGHQLILLNRKKVMTSLLKMSKDSAAANIHPGTKVSTPLREAYLPGSPDKDTHVIYNKLESTLRVIWIFEGRKSAEKPLAIDYQNENLFSLHLKEGMVHFICVNNRKFVDQVLYSTNYTNWSKMKPKNTKQKWEKSEMLFFVAKADINFEKLCQQSIVFDIKMLSTIPNYCYEMADKSWGIQLWEAAYLHVWLTDVTIFIGPKRIMEAHQVILSARSSELCTLLNNLKHEGKANIVFTKTYDQLVVENFLYFLYTGSSKISFKNKQLLQLAVDYKVETLTKVCQLAIIDPPDVDEVTNFLLANF
uniref:BTB domain-containing protein n=1 Tax=Daphnia galeata TaxID=27404 RepID=A0A8J2RGG8_9CRUS|nr:unnamed protein product [Daphnia galeata]